MKNLKDQNYSQQLTLLLDVVDRTGWLVPVVTDLDQSVNTSRSDNSSPLKFSPQKRYYSRTCFERPLKFSTNNGPKSQVDLQNRDKISNKKDKHSDKSQPPVLG